MTALQWLLNNSKIYKQANIPVDPNKLPVSEPDSSECANEPAADHADIPDTHDSDDDGFSEIDETEKK